MTLKRVRQDKPPFGQACNNRIQQRLRLPHPPPLQCLPSQTPINVHATHLYYTTLVLSSKSTLSTTFNLKNIFRRLSIMDAALEFCPICSASLLNNILFRGKRQPFANEIRYQCSSGETLTARLVGSECTKSKAKTKVILALATGTTC